MDNVTKEELVEAVRTLECIIEETFSYTKGMPCDDEYEDVYQDYRDYMETTVGQL